MGTLPHRSVPRIAVLVVAALASLGLAGCNVVTFGGCPGWVDYSDPNEAFAAADAVLVGQVLERDGVMADDLGDSRAYTFNVEEVHKGDVEGPTVRIGSRADTCDAGNGYTSGDLLATDERILVYLTQVQGGLMTLTPGQGVTPLEEGAPLPFQPAGG
jgi:hypothetical protein